MVLTYQLIFHVNLIQMKNAKQLAAYALSAWCGAFLACGSPDGEQHANVLYKSDAYTVYADSVVQGDFVAKALSDSVIVSDYQSPADEAFGRMLTFKFSLNRKDNELPVGANHTVVVRPSQGSFETPLIVFGQQATAAEQPKAGDYLEPDTRVTFRLDMRPVLQSFEQKGYYENAAGQRMSKSDFKGVYIAGGNEPLMWDFENLGDDKKLQDPDGDGIYTVSFVFNPSKAETNPERTWKLSKDISAFPQLKSDFRLVNALYNLTLEEVLLNTEADGTFRTGAKWDGVWTRDISYAIMLGLGMVDPEHSINSLRRKVKDGRIVQDTGSGGSWPVSSDRVVWALAAWELYCVTGDEAWLRESYQVIRNTLVQDSTTVFSPDGLVLGESSFLDWRKQTYPVWMSNVDIYRSECIGTNAVHYAVFGVAAQMAGKLGHTQDETLWKQQAEQLGKAINTHLWLPEQGYYAQYRYGREFMYTSPSSETLGEALSVLYGLADAQRAGQIMEKTPIVAWGAPCVYPQIPDIQPYHNNGIWPFVQSFWNLAAAQTGHEQVLEQGLASLWRAAAMFLTNKENFVAKNGDHKTELNSDRQTWSVGGQLGMVYKVMAGMRLQPDGIAFAPFVPAPYAGTMQLLGFKYRQAELDIVLKGHGNEIASFRLDGQDAKPFVPATLKGKHTVEIELREGTTYKGMNLQPYVDAPATPLVKLAGDKLQWATVPGAVVYEVMADGKPVATVKETEFSISQVKAEEVVVRAKDAKGFYSYVSEPLLVDVKPVVLDAEQVAAPVAMKLQGHTGKGAVELLPGTPVLRFEVNLPKAGKYFVQARYSNGSGPVNTDNKCAIRTLSHNGKRVGVLVMAQQGTDEWSNWYYTNGYWMELPAGKQSFEVYFAPENRNMNGEVNRALIDHLRLVPIK